MQAPVKFELVVSLKAAKALGLDVPQEPLNEVRVRPYEGVVTAARSGALVPTYEADDPASIALYHRAAAFCHSMRATL